MSKLEHMFRPLHRSLQIFIYYYLLYKTHQSPNILLDYKVHILKLPTIIVYIISRDP